MKLTTIEITIDSDDRVVVIVVLRPIVKAPPPVLRMVSERDVDTTAEIVEDVREGRAA